MAGNRKRKARTEFSKLITTGVMLAYFLVLLLGMYLVMIIMRDYPEYAVQALIALFSYVGAPTATTIGFYAWKAKAENVKKIHNSTGERILINDEDIME